MVDQDGQSFSVKGKTALVTGSTRGFGRAFAEALARRGAHVILHGRDVDRAQEAADQIHDRTGSTPSIIICDLADPVGAERVLNAHSDLLGGVDVLVNNAGVQHRRPIETFAVQDWQRVMAVNLTGAFLMSRHVVGGMKRRASGAIINICSVQASLARPTIAAYAASKGGMVMLTRSLTAEYAAFGVRVNGLAPGYFRTEMTQALVDDVAFSQWVHDRTPAGRWGQVGELVGPLVFLASDAASFVHGQILYVDGGMSSVV